MRHTAGRLLPRLDLLLILCSPIFLLLTLLTKLLGSFSKSLSVPAPLNVFPGLRVLGLRLRTLVHFYTDILDRVRDGVQVSQLIPSLLGLKLQPLENELDVKELTLLNCFTENYKIYFYFISGFKNTMLFS